METFSKHQEADYHCLHLCVTSAECERSISLLRYLKNFMRCTMLEEQLIGLALLYVHRDIDCPPEMAFARQQPRRLSLVDPFTE